MANDDVWMACEKHLGKFGAVLNCAPCLQVTLDYVRAALREARKERELIRTLAEQYKADPINAYDRPSSWGKLEAEAAGRGGWGWSAPMANEDVLERARNFDRELSEADKQRRMVDLGALHLIHALAAELREAREELGVLRSKAMQLDVGNAVKAAIRESNAEIAALDAAMKPPGGEDGA